METLLGLVRDCVVAVIGVLILLGVNISDELTAGILLLLATFFALGSYIYNRWKGTPRA